MSEITGRDFGRLEGKVDTLVDGQKDVLARLATLELRGAHSAGRASVFGLLAGFVASALSAWFARHFA